MIDCLHALPVNRQVRELEVLTAVLQKSGGTDLTVLGWKPSGRERFQVAKFSGGSDPVGGPMVLQIRNHLSEPARDTGQTRYRRRQKDDTSLGSTSIPPENGQGSMRSWLRITLATEPRAMRAPLIAVFIIVEAIASRGPIMPLFLAALIAHEMFALVCKERLYHGLAEPWRMPLATAASRTN